MIELTEARIAEFWSKVEKTDGCWYWRGTVGAHGYGSFYAGNGKNIYAHRLSYLMSKGLIASRLQIDHVCHSMDKTCKNNPCIHRRCVNPAHLEAVTPQTNVSRGRLKDSAENECKYGHSRLV